MGQKIHPEGFRVGYIHDWKSTWFEEKNFADVLQEDLQIRDHIEKKLSHAGLSRITIERRGEVAVARSNGPSSTRNWSPSRSPSSCRTGSPSGAR